MPRVLSAVAYLECCSKWFCCVVLVLCMQMLQVFLTCYDSMLLCMKMLSMLLTSAGAAGAFAVYVDAAYVDCWLLLLLVQCVQGMLMMLV